MARTVGEMEKHSGNVRMGGRLAYVAQQAWIVNDSLQKNVLFGHELEQQRWDSCVHACSLQQDLEVSGPCGSLPQMPCNVLMQYLADTSTHLKGSAAISVTSRLY